MNMTGIVSLFVIFIFNTAITQGQVDELFETIPATEVPSSSDGDHGDAFEHSHEEGEHEEHVVNKEVCSPQDLPSETMAAYDRCTNFIPVYKVCQILLSLPTDQQLFSSNFFHFSFLAFL